MAVTTFTTTAADDLRLQAWANAAGATSVKALIIKTIQLSVQQFEQSPQSGSAFAPPVYTPINPT